MGTCISDMYVRESRTQRVSLKDVAHLQYRAVMWIRIRIRIRIRSDPDSFGSVDPDPDPEA